MDYSSPQQVQQQHQGGVSAEHHHHHNQGQGQTQQSSQQGSPQDYAGHGQRITLAQAQYGMQQQHQQYFTQGTTAAVPGATATASSAGLPLYRDQSGQLHLSSSNDAGGTSSSNQLTLYSQGTAPNTHQSSSRRPSISIQSKRTKSSRNQPYILRQPSSSASSVHSNSSNHSQHSSSSSHNNNNNNTDIPTGGVTVYYASTTTTSTPSYPNLGVLPSSTDIPVHQAGGNMNDTPSASSTVWPPANYIHSRSSSVSSASSEFSSASQDSSGWSDVNDTNETGNTSSGNGLNKYYSANPNNSAAYYNGYHSTPAMQVAYEQPLLQRSVSADSTGSTSFSSAHQRTNQQHRYHQAQIQLRALQNSSAISSSGAMYPVVLQPARGGGGGQSSSAYSQYSSPVNNAGMGFGNGGFGESGSQPARSLTGLAEAIRKSAGSTNTTEKARINFVHGWLKQSFMLSLEGNISRHALYQAYIHTCHQYNLAPINAASYGKAVRSCWPGIKTRRLGVRGASRYHYCGIRASNEDMRNIVDYYNGFDDATGKPISCEMPPGSSGDSSDGHGGDGTGQWGSDEVDEDSFGQDGLIAHMGELHGLGGDDTSSNGSHHSNQGINNFSNIPSSFQQQSMFQPKIERPGSAFSVIERPPSAYSDAGIRFSINDAASDASGPSLNGPFAGGQHQNQLRRQTSVPTSLHEQSLNDQQYHHDHHQQQHHQQQQQNENLDFNFNEMKTPTAFQFMQSNQHALQQNNVYASGSSSSTVSSSNTLSGNGTPNLSAHGNGSRLAVPSLFGAVAALRNGNGGIQTQEQSNMGQNSGAQLASGRTPSPALNMSRSASIPSSSTAADTFALRFKGRRATLPNLQITIPPTARNPLSSSSTRPSSSLSRCDDVSEEHEATMESTAHGQADDQEDEQDEDDQMHEGKKTARLLPRGGTQEMQSSSLSAMLDLPLPSFQDILQNFSQRLVTSPNHHATRTSSASPGGNALGGDNADGNAALSADDVIAARNNVMALLKTLDMAHADAIWELYRTSHCRGLLRLVQQGRLEEFEGAFLLFWSQLDPTQQAIVQHPLLRDAMYQADAVLYPFLLTQLSERVLQSGQGSQEPPAQGQQQNHLLPMDLTQLVNVAKNMEEWAVAAFDSYPTEFADCRVELASRMAHLLARLAGVAQLGQAVSDILQQPESLKELIKAWDILDFDMILNQGALVTGCPQEAIQSYFDGVYMVIRQASSSSEEGSEDNIVNLGHFTQLADELLERYSTQLADLSAHLSGARADMKNSQAGDAFAASVLKMDERPFLMKWSYLSGQILRDLTLSSSPAFGSFQIISLFLEEYLSFKILKNYTLRSDNIAASIQADTDPSASGQLAVPAYYINTGTGSTAGMNSTLMDIVKEQENVNMAFLLSPQNTTLSAARGRISGTHKASSNAGVNASNSGQGQSGLGHLSASNSGFMIPLGQPASASAFNTSFNLSLPSSTSTIWSPATRSLFGELSLPSATLLAFPRHSHHQGESESRSSAPSNSGPSTDLAILPPPTPSAFSSFPNLRSPGLSRYFPSSSSDQ